MARSFLCPRCFEMQNTKDIQYICSNTYGSPACSHAIGRVKQIPASRKKPLCSECGRQMIHQVCPSCGTPLPLNFESSDSYPIAIVGAKESGKSNFVAVLIQELQTRITAAFDCSLMACGDRTMERYKTEFHDPLYLHRTCVRGTDAGEVDPLIYALIFQRRSKFLHRSYNEAVSLTFFDAAGENFDSADAMHTFTPYLCHSSGIILLLDPLQLPKVREQLAGRIRLPEKNTDTSSILARTIETIRRGTGNTDMSRKIDIPVAVAFTKIDAVDDLLDPSSCLKAESSHVEQGFFDQADFQNSSDEMRSLVDAWMGPELSHTLSAHFSKYAFFGLSALGTNPDLEGRISRLSPFRVTDPFLWILAQDKLVPTR